jgi:hypothetical protein
MIIRILLSLLLGLLSSLFVLEQDPAIKNALGNYCIAMFESAMHCHMKCTIGKLDFLGRTIELEDVDVSPKEQAADAWHWTCRRYKIKISILALVMRKVLSMDMVLEDINASSRLEHNNLAIMPHLQLLISFSAAAALELKNLCLRHVHLSAEDPVEGHLIDIGFDNDTHIKNNHLTMIFHLTHGNGAYAHRKLIEDLQGSCVCDIQVDCSDLKESVKAQVDCSCHVPQLKGDEKTCFINAQYEHGAATLHIKNAHEYIVAGPMKVKFTQEGIVAGGVVKVPLEYLVVLMRNSAKGPLPKGYCMLRLQGVYNAEGLSCKGACGIKDLYWGKTKIASLIAGTFSRMKNMWQGHVLINRDELALDGTWHWNEQKGEGVLNLENTSPVSCGESTGIVLGPHACSIKATFDDAYTINGAYDVLISHTKSGVQDILAGSVKADKQGMKIEGRYNDYTYILSGTYNPCMRIAKFEIKNEKQEQLCEVHGYDHIAGSCKGTMELKAVKPLIKKFTGIDIPGEGKLKVYGTISDGLLMVKTKLENGTIRIPQTYMCVTGFDSLVCLDPLRRELMVKYAHLQLYEGSITCRRATMHFDDSWHIAYIQIPLVIDHCLFNIRKDLFGIISGNLLFTQNPHACPHINGVLLIDRAQLTENLFSGVLHDVASHSAQGLKAANRLDATCDLQLITYNPIKVNTVFLDAEARMDMHIQGKVLEPTLDGFVSLSSGRLIFPYRPLNITKAVVRLSPSALTDPLIEIVAKNRVKKYMISLQVAGSLQNHQIVLSSTPPLSNEQILALLLVGSEEESLGNMVPALVMQNIKPLIFGSGQTKFLEKYFNVLLKPLQYIHFVPSFGDQTGRGGLRGKLEIDLNDRWRAMIQNNFNLSEDTRFEIEYMLSDDISLKGSRDEHRDITGEVEMRWKFK